MSEPSRSPFAAYPDDGTFDESKAPDITAWKLARQALEHENDLINHRYTWFFQAQAALLTAFFLVSTTWEKFVVDKFHFGLLVLGLITFLAIAMCLITRDGLARAQLELDRITNHYNGLKALHRFERTPPLHNRDPKTTFDSTRMPQLTAGMWIVLMAGSAYLHWGDLPVWLGGSAPLATTPASSPSGPAVQPVAASAPKAR